MTRPFVWSKMNFKISKVADAAINECRKAGVQLTDENIIYIYELGKIADGTIGSPFQYWRGKDVGNIRIYPITMGAKLWLMYEAKELCGFDESLYGWAVIYAFGHSFEPEKLEFKDIKEFRRAIIKWGRKINCTDGEITKALVEMGEFSDFDNEVKKDADNDRTQSDKCTISPILSFLMKEFGKDIHYWLWEVSENQINEMIREYSKQMSGKDKKKTIVSSDDLPIKAYVKLRNYVENLKQANKIEVNNVIR